MSDREPAIRPSDLVFGDTRYEIYRVSDVPDTDLLPVSLRIVAENTLRAAARSGADIDSVADLINGRTGANPDLDFFPARVLMHDLSGIPALLDLAALREAVAHVNPAAPPVDPSLPVDFVVDHSVVAEASGDAQAFGRNAETDQLLNAERYSFLRWAAGAFTGVRLLPPNRGICHQVNLEYLASVVRLEGRLAIPDSVIGTDSHTPMINALGVLGWGVGGIEAEAALLGLPVTMTLPTVVGIRLIGELRPGTTATDAALTINQQLRSLGVVGQFVEFTGPGLAGLSIATRATISNMCPEYGSTCALFPIDEQTLRYLRLTSRAPDHIALVESYAKEQGLWRTDGLSYATVLEVDLSDIEPSVAGPSRPNQRMRLADVPAAVANVTTRLGSPAPSSTPSPARVELPRGAVVLAAITSCTNTSNPHVMVGAGLVAQRARQRGLSLKPWVKATLAPGSVTVTAYLRSAGLLASLNELGFWLVGYGCTTCMGNSGDLLPGVGRAAEQTATPLAAVLSGNRNFPGRIHPDVSMNFLASPPLVVAYALAGSMDIDLTREPLGTDDDGTPVWLADLWPADGEIDAVIAKHVQPEQFVAAYADVAEPHSVAPHSSDTGFAWDPMSTYLQRPPFFDDISMTTTLRDVIGARALVVAGDSVPTRPHFSGRGNRR